MDDYLGFIEFFVVAMFVMAWGVLELVGKRLEKRRKPNGQSRRTRARHPRWRLLSPRPRHPERQHRLYDRHLEAIQRQAFVHQCHGFIQQLG